MFCNGCGKKFTLLRSEHGCPGCGFAYCKRCLTDKVYVEKFDKKKKACSNCKMSENSDKNNPDPNTFEPPKAYLRRIESLDNPSKPPITLYQSSSRMQQLKRGLSEADQEIADRLEKLREDRKKGPTPSDVEIRDRLAKLRDEPTATSAPKSNLPRPDTRSDQQKSDDLLNQYMAECEIENKRANVDCDIRQRLDKLKDSNSVEKGSENAQVKNVSDKEMVMRVIQEAMMAVSDDELSDDKSSEILSSDDDMSDEDL
ncbi:abscission/NoCut checkpoint regulator isoform X2 [Arctopsyche grandis]|uniref:abscission/NoCut checkpoint regulator isoform X2 n=1 Tax=Arctopsyche grandis TaxID=121162 RepID=UPI00406D8804